MDFGPRKLGSEQTMKVDPRTEPSRDVPSVSADHLRQAAKPAASASDEVALSDTLKVADAAVRAAAVLGDVRPEAVARARELMTTGRLGADPEALADRIIHSLLESRDTPT
jgi:anti-sigma28 factor (negative regulator of flagellin synthesis)